MTDRNDTAWTWITRISSILILFGLIIGLPLTCTFIKTEITKDVDAKFSEQFSIIKNNDLAHLRLSDEYSMEKDNIMISYQFGDITKETAKDRLLQVEKWKGYALGILAQNLTLDSKKDYLPFPDWLTNGDRHRLSIWAAQCEMRSLSRS
jgi:hypothetical protein